MQKKTKKENKVEIKPIVELVDLVKIYNERKILDNLNISINKGEFITLLGASGSGKTTALRLIAGFEWPTRGEIKFNGVDVKDLPPHKRMTKTIFQDYALFPHLSVAGNIKYGLKLLKVPKKLEKEAKKELLSRLNENKKLWKVKQKEKFEILDKEQNQYEETLKKNNKKSIQYRRARKWLDDSDFKYSYWENFVNLKVEHFENKYLSRKLTRAEINQKVENAISLVGLEGNDKKSIDELSGGMKQRVALARALVTEPKLLLLDEPLSALDLKVRQKMQKELKALQKKLDITFIFVTHDQEEAMTISDRIAVLNNGKIEQFDKPQIIYEYPVNSWVASFIGESNIFNAKVHSKNKLSAFNQVLPGDTYDFKKGHKIKVMLRPEDISIVTKNNFIKGKIVTSTFQGTFWEYAVQTDKRKWRVRTIKSYKVGTEVGLAWTAEAVHSMEK